MRNALSAAMDERNRAAARCVGILEGLLGTGRIPEHHQPYVRAALARHENASRLVAAIIRHPSSATAGDVARAARAEVHPPDPSAPALATISPIRPYDGGFRWHSEKE